MKKIFSFLVAIVGTCLTLEASALEAREFRIEGFARVRRVQYFLGHNISVASFIGAKIAGQPRFVRARCVASTLNLMFFDQIATPSKDKTPRVALTEHLRYEIGSDVECDLLARAIFERRETSATVSLTNAGVTVR